MAANGDDRTRPGQSWTGRPITGQQGTGQQRTGQHRPSTTGQQPALRDTGELTVWHDYAGRPRYRTHHARRGSGKFGSFLRVVAGSMAAGLLVLAFCLLGVQIWAGNNGLEGPGVDDVVTHFVAAVLALVLNGIAERRKGRFGGLCCLGSFLCVLAAVWFWWWL